MPRFSQDDIIVDYEIHTDTNMVYYEVRIDHVTAITTCTLEQFNQAMAACKDEIPMTMAEYEQAELAMPADPEARWIP